MSSPGFHGSEAERMGWERRALSDMAAAPLVYCFPGFMGAVCERLVEKGLATKQSAGFMAPPENVTPRQLKGWGWRAEDYALFRYTITAGGRAALGQAEPA